MSPLLLALLAAAPDVAVLSTKPGDGFTELRFQKLGATELSPAVARFEHLDDATALGALIPGTRQVVATATVLRGDASFASALVLLEPGQPTRVLADQVAVGNRPVVTPGGRIFVQRGVAGSSVTPLVPGSKPRNAELRVDDVRVDEVRLDGQTRTLFEMRGYAAFVAGVAGCSDDRPSPGLRPPSPRGEGLTGDPGLRPPSPRGEGSSMACEVIVYRVAPGEAALVAVDVDTLAQRTLTRIEPLARDFVVDDATQRLVFTLGKSATRSWHVVSVDLRTGALTTLATGNVPALLPFVVDGKVTLAARDAEGVGFEHLRFVTGDGTRVGLDEIPSEFPHPFAIDARVKKLSLVAPAGARLDLAGVAP